MTQGSYCCDLQEEPLKRWKSGSAFVFTLLLIAVLSEMRGDFLYTLLFFFPIQSIFRGIFFNRLEKTYFGILALLAYPVVKIISVAVFAVIANAVDSAGPGMPQGVAYGVNYSIMAVCYFISLPFIAMGARALPEFRIPDPAYKTIQITGFLLALLAVMILVGWGGAVCNQRFLRIPAGLTILLWLVIIALSVCGAIKMIKKVLSDEPQMLMAVDGASDPHCRLNMDKTMPSLADVAGMDDVKKQLKLRLIDPIKNPRMAAKYGLKAGGGVMLYGPPGTGKTFIARAVAGELKLPFYMINGADVFGKYVGEAENNIRNIFAEARKNPLSVVFVDEMETIFTKRTDDIHEVTRKVISVILQELDGVDKNKNPILLLGATNTPWQIDEAFLRPGRFDILAYVGLPDKKARTHLLRLALEGGSLQYEEGLIEYIAENTESYSGADLNGVLDKLRQTAFENRSEYYSLQMAYNVLCQTNPSGNHGIIEKIRKWESEYFNTASDEMALQERPNVKLADVAGMAEVKEQLRLRLIEPILNPELAARYGLKVGGGVMLYGPPGTGKTFIARAVAGELELPFYTITSADIFGKYVGEAENNIRNIFANARKNPLSVVFVDEMETIFTKRTGGVHEVTQKVISVMLQELDGVDKSKNPILLLGATNTPWQIDEAFLRPGRFDILAYVGLPDKEARWQILRNLFKQNNLPCEKGLLEYITQNTDSYSGADLKGLVEKMQQKAFINRDRYYSMKLAYKVMLENKPSCKKSMIEEIRRWEAARR